MPPKDEESMPKQWVGCDIEADYFGDDRKLGKQERKKASAKDRSKYKKTDKAKHLKNAEDIISQKLDRDKLIKGRVISSANEGIIVVTENKTYQCILRGLLKKEKGQHKNLVVVGDFVLFEPLSENEGVISYVEPRKSVLSRADNLSRRREQLIAANIDQVIITVSVVSPPLRPFIVDRYIIAARKGHMEPIIVVNKADLLENPDYEGEKELLDDFIAAYEQEGLVIPVSATTGEGIEQLREAMKDKASVFSGQSGVGKSSLINAVTGGNLRVGDVVLRTQKGAHTTSSAQLLPLSFGGWCIDTPGIKSFGLWDLDKNEIAPHFKDIFEKGRECRFVDCSHIHEQGCAVVEAVEKGEISPLRYQSYLALVTSVNEEHLRR